MYYNNDTIVAIATPPGQGAIGIIRLSGEQAIPIANVIFKGKNLELQPSHTLHFGSIIDGNNIIDEVVVSLFRNPKSYTGEDVIEISCHGSPYVLEHVLRLCLSKGARAARAGEFTQRAFLNSKLDLAQAEAVADLIASQSASAHKAAMHNLKGGFSTDLHNMREQLIKFSALLELELDFSEEDVEFADRTAFNTLIADIVSYTSQLIESFKLGNVIKNGVSVAITGKPNAGKSTLLNALLNEDRAIVSEIAGTTRDTIEEVLNINGIHFRLVDTAGMRENASDSIEAMGIARSKAAIEKADIVIHLFDVTEYLSTPATLLHLLEDQIKLWTQSNTPYLLAANKADMVLKDHATHFFENAGLKVALLSAKQNENISTIKDKLFRIAADGLLHHEGTIVTNARHFGALNDVLTSLRDVQAGLENRLSGDLISLDLRRCLHYLGEITGQVTTEDKLDYIFSKFCIGK